MSMIIVILNNKQNVLVAVLQTMTRQRETVTLKILNLETTSIVIYRVTSRDHLLNETRRK